MMLCHSVTSVARVGTPVLPMMICVKPSAVLPSFHLIRRIRCSRHYNPSLKSSIMLILTCFFHYMWPALNKDPLSYPSPPPTPLTHILPITDFGGGGISWNHLVHMFVHVPELCLDYVFWTTYSVKTNLGAMGHRHELKFHVRLQSLRSRHSGERKP